MKIVNKLLGLFKKKGEGVIPTLIFTIYPVKKIGNINIGVEGFKVVAEYSINNPMFDVNGEYIHLAFKRTGLIKHVNNVVSYVTCINTKLGAFIDIGDTIYRNKDYETTVKDKDDKPIKVVIKFDVVKEDHE